MTAKFRTPNSKVVLGFAVFLAAAGAISACSPVGGPMKKTEMTNTPNETGSKTPEGKAYTGAGHDQELLKLKTQIAGDPVLDNGAGVESISKVDRALATSILSARLETGAKNSIQIHILLRDSTRMVFNFTDKEIATANAKDAANDTRYKAVIGQTPEGGPAAFELAMICRKAKVADGQPAPAGCRSATLALKETRAEGAKAGLIVRSQEVTVQSRAAEGASLKHETLKRLQNELKTGKSGYMQSFEIAWGASGFSVNFGDTEICPVGRLVETNDLDEPLRLNCVGVQAFRDLQGQMIGNTTRGELLLEMTAATPGFIHETVDNLYLLIRQKREAKPAVAAPAKDPKTTPSAVPGAKAPVNPKAPVAPVVAPVVATDDEDDGDDDPVFEDPKTAAAKKNADVQVVGGGLFNVDVNSVYAKTLAKDRQHPVIAAGIKKWLSTPAMKSFAFHFLPNRDLMQRQLGSQSVPLFFSLLTFNESNFFKVDGYPIEGPLGSSAAGPWQFLDQTAKNNGLRITERGTRTPRNVVNACDERAHLERSTLAAGKYLGKIIKMFPNDPKLVLLGYNQGEYGVDGQLKSLKRSTSEARLQVVRELGIGFWAIKKFNMAKTSGIQYVEKFVSQYHATLERTDLPKSSNVAPWSPKANASCRVW